ncbi:putative baseplate assembly protein [Candidatus Gracilibacteria bacterium]|nr:putative baseplate assembly protein [Candidatus Gracilibacteria bacterium]
MSATHAQAVVNEVLGRSNGMPGQQFKLEIAPVLPRRNGETLEVQNPDGSWEAWEEREHFGSSMPGNMHFALDSVSGIVGFGPTVRDPEGGERQYGAIPPEGALIRMSCYRSGGGVAGNVGSERITVLKTAVPYIARVHNRKPSVGGRDAETLEHAQMRAPKVLRTSFRAVSAEDYEFLAREASSGIARVRCLQPRASGSTGSPPAGVVRVLIVPHVGHPERRLLPEQLRPPREMIQDVQSYLDERRLLTTRLEIGVPTYTLVGIQARLKARPEADPEKVKADAEARLYRFINPLIGGPGGDGWPFGRDLYISEVLALLQGTPGVEYVEGARMQVQGQSSEGALNKITLAPDHLLTSAEHSIVVVK